MGRKHLSYLAQNVAISLPCCCHPSKVDGRAAVNPFAIAEEHIIQPASGSSRKAVNSTAKGY